MPSFSYMWKVQQTTMTNYLQSEIGEVSGRIFFSQWRTDDIDAFPMIQSYIVDDNPEIIRHGADTAYYRTNTRWRFVYRFIADPDARDNDFIALKSGVSGICRAFSQYQASAEWDYATINNINFLYESPGIDVGLVEEASVDVIIRSAAEGG